MVKNYRYSVIEYNKNGDIINEYNAKTIREIVEKTNLHLHIIRALYLKRTQRPRDELANIMKVLEVIIIDDSIDE